ncbi:MAG: TM1812 family CRISPR-associated protein [Candidatus Paceibacterota bacterium]
MPSDHPHILLSSMGAGNPGRPPVLSHYNLADGECECRFSAVALWKLLPVEHRPSEIWYLLTPEAREYAEQHILDETRQAGVPVHFVDLLGNETSDDSRAFLEIVAERLPQGCRLTLDVTRGLRHHAFLFYALALYLSEFRGVRIGGAWYCRWEISGDPAVPRPFIDLKPVLDLARWVYALAVFRDQGQLLPMAQIIRPRVDRLRKHAQTQQNDPALHKRASELQKITDALEKQSFANATGLPLETGKASRFVADRIQSLTATALGSDLPLLGSLTQMIADAAESTAFCELPVASGNWKETTELNWQELQRQARMINAYLDRGDLSLGIGLMREWVISWMMWKNGRIDRWLGYSARKPEEQRLGAIGALLKRDAGVIDPTPAQREYGIFWNQLSDELRNALLHHGMRQQAIEEPPESLEKVRQFWNRLKRDEVELPEFGGGHGRLLICPIGLTPGVLFSAVSHTRPNRALVIASRESEAAIDDALSRAGGSVDILRLTMTNAHTGIKEFDILLNEASHWLFEADAIHANLTGGTTLMGVLVGELVKRATREYQRQVREFVLIDERPPEAQRADPWQLGHIHYLDGQTEVESGT